MRWGECVLRGFFSFFLFFSFFCPLFLRIVAMDEEEEMSRKNKKYNESRLGKQAIGFCCTESVPKKKSMPCLPSLPLSFSLLLLHYPEDRSPVLQNPHPFPIPCFFFLFFFPRISTDTLVLIPTYPLYLAPRVGILAPITSKTRPDR